MNAEKRRAAAARAAKKARKEREERAQISIAKWRRFEDSRLAWSVDTGTDYLRINTGAGTVETSQNISISIGEAAALILLRDVGRLVGKQVKGLYKVTRSDAKGVKVGCHNISSEEIENLRGLIDNYILNRIKKR